MTTKLERNLNGVLNEFEKLERLAAQLGAYALALSEHDCTDELRRACGLPDNWRTRVRELATHD